MVEEGASKEELAQKLRDIMDTDVKFERLSKGDLVKLLEIFTVMGRLAQVAVKSKAYRVEEIFREGAREVLSKPVGGMFRGKGVLGLGIGPRLLQRLGLTPPEEEEPAKETEES